MSQYCTCRSLDMDEMSVVDAPPSWSSWYAYACPRCKKLSHAVQENGPDMYMPHGAIAPLGSHGGSDGIWINTFAVPDSDKITCIEYIPYPRRIDDMSIDQGRNILLDLWVLLDRKVDVIMSPPYGPGDNDLEAAAREDARKEARGVAESIQIIMSSFYPNANAVVKEAVARAKSRYALEPFHNTPGLAEELWDPKPKVMKQSKPVASTPKKFTVPKKSEVALKPDEINGIKEAVTSGIFGKEEIAAMFKVTLAQVEAAIAS